MTNTENFYEKYKKSKFLGKGSYGHIYEITEINT